MRLLILLSLTIASTWSQDCSLFQEGACPLSEENIVGSDRFTETPQDCQNLCRETSHSDCAFFTHFNTECYLLTACDSVEPCDGCMSGPANPLLSDCEATTDMPATTTAMPATTTALPATTTAMPATTTAMPATTTAMPATTTAMPATTTAMPATTTTAPTTMPPTTTTTMAPTTTTTMAPTTTTTLAPTTTTMEETTVAKCDVNNGVICDDPAHQIEHIEHISHASDCQAICQNHPECNFWSHYAEEGHEHWGHCLIYTDCRETTDHECFDEGSHECPPQPPFIFQANGRENEPRPGPGRKCYCVSGGNSPDLDECDDGTTTNDPSCSDEFYPGWLCNEEENLIGEIEGISDPSDCQAICQNRDDCEFFNYYREEDWGYCQLHSSCSNFVEHEWCTEHHGEHNCFAGPKYPDLDDCSYPELF